jgi:hypothetical protein
MKTSSLFKKENAGELVLAILFIIYLIMGYKTPEPVASMLDSLVGKVVIFVIVIYMFMNHNPVLAVLALFVAFDLIRRSSATTGDTMTISQLQKFAPSEKNKMSQFTAFNQFPYTLEQEVIKKMAPVVKPGSSVAKASYKPLLENLYDASPLDASN